MASVLILGLYYPPANFMAGRRLEGWAHHLPSFGYEPLVLTRYYDPAERNSQDFYASSRPTRTLKTPWVEEDGAAYTAFEPGLWSKLPLPGFVRGLGHYAWPDPDHSGWFRQCYSYLKASDFKPDIIIASSGPAGVFRIARRLARWLHVPWVADFRDIWIEKFDRSLDTRIKYAMQRRHLRSASGITVVSEGMGDELRKQLLPLKKPLALVYNGAEPVEDSKPDSQDAAAVSAFRDISGRYDLVLTYAGSLYPPQETERVLETIASFNEEGGHTCAVVLCGAHDARQYDRWPFVKVLGTVQQRTAVFLQRESSALFYPTWPERYSGFSGKIFEQVLSGRPVLVCFSPSPDLEALCQNFETVFLPKEPEALKETLRRLPEMKIAGEGEPPAIATKEYWTGKLATFLDEVRAQQGSAVA
jgi:glycosyltransferase involved in cell wall biosynthesis